MLWTSTFAVLAAIVATAYAYSCLIQILNPWDMRHHALFAGKYLAFEMFVTIAPLNSVTQDIADKGTRIARAYAGILSPWSVAMGELASAVCILLAGCALWRHPGLKGRDRTQEQKFGWLAAAPLVMGMCLSLFWAHALFGSIKVDRQMSSLHFFLTLSQMMHTEAS